MSEFLFGFTTGLSFILAIGAQNLFVIEQGIKKNHIFLITTICALSDFLLIFLGIFIFYSIQSMMTKTVALFFNLALIIFLVHFIWGKIKSFHTPLEVNTSNDVTSKSTIIAQTLGFTFLNPHVYSDTVFILGNLSKSFVSLGQKMLFGFGATLASFLFFYFIGYMGYFLRRYFLNKKIWNITNSIIIIYLIGLVIFLIVSEFF